MNMYLKMSSGKWRPFCVGLNVIPGIPDNDGLLDCHLTHTLLKSLFIAYDQCVLRVGDNQTDFHLITRQI